MNIVETITELMCMRRDITDKDNPQRGRKVDMEIEFKELQTCCVHQRIGGSYPNDKCSLSDNACIEENCPLKKALTGPAVVQRQFSEAEMREAFEAGCLITNMTKTVAQAEREFAVWMQKWLSKVKVIVR